MTVNVTGLSMLASVRIDQGSVVKVQQDLVQGFEQSARMSKEVWKGFEDYLSKMAQRADPGQALVGQMEKAFQSVLKSPSLSNLERKLKDLKSLEETFTRTNNPKLSGIAGTGIGHVERMLGVPANPLNNLFGGMESSVRAFQRALDDCKSSAILTGLELQKAAAVQEDAIKRNYVSFSDRDPNVSMSSKKVSTNDLRRPVIVDGKVWNAEDLRELRLNDKSFYHDNRAGYKKYNRIMQEAAKFEAAYDSYRDETSTESKEKRQGNLEFWHRKDLEERRKEKEEKTVEDRRKQDNLEFWHKKDLEEKEGQKGFINRLVSVSADHVYPEHESSSVVRRRNEKIRDIERDEALYGDLSIRKNRPNSSRFSLSDRRERELDDSLRRRAEELVEPTWAEQRSAERYQSLPNYIQRRIDANTSRQAKRDMSPHGFMSGHNFRFASQNLGFGIDDAIQSYHYGGVGASIRAASNNMTAIAGMTIANPIVAAGTVVALSVATAVLPTVLKRFGIDEHLDKLRKDYSDLKVDPTDGGGIGSIRRKSMTRSSYLARTDEYTKLIDAEEAIQTQRSRSDDYLRSIGLNPELGFNKGKDTPIPSTINENDPEVLSEFHSQMAFREKEFQERKLRNEKISKAQTVMKFSEGQLIGRAGLFAYHEYEHVQEIDHNRNLYRAESLEDYEAELTRRKNEELHRLAIRAGNQNFPMSSIEHEAERSKITVKYADLLSQKYDNRLTVEKNEQERRYYMEDAVNSSYGMTGFGSIAQNLNRKTEEYTVNRNLSALERSTLIDAANDGAKIQFFRLSEDTKRSQFGLSNPTSALNILSRRFNEDIDNDQTLLHDGKLNKIAIADAGFGRQISRSMQDQVRSNLGYDDALSALSIIHRRRKEDYSSDDDLTKEQQSKLIASANAGFDFQRKMLMFSMANEHKITNNVGALQDKFTMDVVKLQRQIESGELSPEEGNFLSGRLKKSYSAQMRSINTPSGVERFTADSQLVGGAADRELEMRMTGNFSGPKPLNSFEEKSLDQFGQMLVELSKLNANLAAARLGL